MKNFLAILGAAAVLSFAAPAQAVNTSVAEPTTGTTFHTALLAEQRFEAGEISGTMHVSISPEGIVQGYYRSDATGRMQMVVGGVTGRDIWLDIGGAHDIHIEGTYLNGTIVGYTYLDQQYKFEATPTYGV